MAHIALRGLFWCDRGDDRGVDPGVDRGVALVAGLAHASILGAPEGYGCLA